MTPQLSVVIPVFARPIELARCLASLKPRIVGVNVEIVVVDDASPSDDVKCVARQYGARHIRVNKRRGSAYCKNIGIDEAASATLLFLDSDIEFPTSTSIMAMMSLLDDTAECGQVGGEGLVDGSGRVTHIFGRNIDPQTGQSRCDYRHVDSCFMPVVYDYVPTSNCMVRRSDAIRANGFDDFYLGLGEDKDFGYRLGRMGLCSYVPRNGVVLHNFASTGRQDNQLDKLYRTQVRFCLRHYGLRSLARLLREPPPANEGVAANAVPSAATITAFETRYRREILLMATQRTTLALEERSHVIRMGRAIVWNVCHSAGIRQTGSRRILGPTHC